MDERLQYEQQLQQRLNELPLPDENLAWADMNRRLEEDDDKRVIVWWRRGCMLWGFLLLLLLTTGWFLFEPEKWFRNKTNTTAATEKGTDRQDAVKKENVPIKTDQIITEQKSDKVNSANEKLVPVDSLVPIIVKNETPGANKQKPKETNTISTSKTTINKPTIKPFTKSVETPITDQNDKKQERDSIDRSKMQADSTKPITATAHVIKTDSLQKPKTDTVVQAKPIERTTKKPEEKPKDGTPILFSTGIGIHQQLPIAGQKLTPYNSLGRKGSLADYIPSVYLRMGKENKWFLQVEFRYGAPQYTKEFIFRQQSDTSGTPGFSTIKSLNLKKTFYHQLPITFNYFILPNWSVGTGLQWNKFKTAVAENSVIRRNNINQQDSFVSKTVQIFEKDTATEFAKSYFQLVLETQYQWKRFSMGGKYTFGLEPFIRFTLPGQASQEQKNNAFQVFLRYQLWKQKK